MNSPTPPRIRRAEPADLAALVALEQATFAHDRLSRAQYRRHLKSASACILVAVQQHRLLGTAVVFFRRGTGIGRLYSLAIRADTRGRGVGAALLTAAEHAARARRCRAMRLEVRTDNPAAITLYQRHGYLRIGGRAGYYEDGSNAWLFEKPLDHEVLATP